jgi:hypothetical protein
VALADEPAAPGRGIRRVLLDLGQREALVWRHGSPSSSGRDRDLSQRTGAGRKHCDRQGAVPLDPGPQPLLTASSPRAQRAEQQTGQARRGRRGEQALRLGRPGQRRSAERPGTGLDQDPDRHKDRGRVVAHRGDDGGPSWALDRREGRGTVPATIERGRMAVLRGPSRRRLALRRGHSGRGLALMFHAEQGAGHDVALARRVQDGPPGRAPARRVDPAARIFHVRRAPVRAGLGRVPTGFAIRQRMEGASSAGGGAFGPVAVGGARERVGVSGGGEWIRGAVDGGHRGCRVHTDHVMAAGWMCRACARARGMVKQHR